MKVIIYGLCISCIQTWTLDEKSRDIELIDDELSEYNMEEMKRMIGIALLCIQSSHALRPTMSRVVAMLSEDVKVNDVTSKPGHLIDSVFDDTTSSSYSGFQTSNTSFSTSFVTPCHGDNDSSKPMLVFKIKDGRWKCDNVSSIIFYGL